MTRLNRMFPRIVAAQYEVPAHLSRDCCDLISRLMTVDIQSRRALRGSPGLTSGLKNVPELVSAATRCLAFAAGWPHTSCTAATLSAYASFCPSLGDVTATLSYARIDI